jgi:8-oxo-dGTP diphosphatase
MKTPTEIDKIALIYLKDRKVLSTKSKGRRLWYFPGGKRKGQETDEETLSREIKEELNIDIIQSTIRYFGTFRAQADPNAHADGVIVKMTCYMADFLGNPVPSHEIEFVDYLSYQGRFKSSPVDQIIFDRLKADELID